MVTSRGGPILTTFMFQSQGSSGQTQSQSQFADLRNYKLVQAFDEMFVAEGKLHEHYGPLLSMLSDLPPAEMQRRKLPISVLDETDGSGRDWHHVRLGSFATQEQASMRLAELTRDQGLSGVIVTEPPPAAKS